MLHNIDYIIPEDPAVTKEEAVSVRSPRFTFWPIQRGAQQKHQAELLTEPWNFLSSRMNESFFLKQRRRDSSAIHTPCDTDHQGFLVLYLAVSEHPLLWRRDVHGRFEAHFSFLLFSFVVMQL